jgi:hypothetical protein
MWSPGVAKVRMPTMPTSDDLDPSLKTDRATISLPKGVQREQYRGADWLRSRVQEPQKRWIPGKVERVRIHLPPASSLSQR